MISLNRFRRSAFVALVLFAFAQAAAAAMGCAALRADAGRGNVAVMPSGEPCDMLGAAPAPLALKHCVVDDGQTTQSASPAFDQTPLALIAVLRPPVLPMPAAFTDGLDASRILGPPPFRRTRRLRI